jgi:arginine deiminase
MLTENKNTSPAFGVYSEVGKLKKLWYVHRGWRMNALPGNCDRMLFDDVLWVANANAITSIL